MMKAMADGNVATSNEPSKVASKLRPKSDMVVKRSRKDAGDVRLMCGISFDGAWVQYSLRKEPNELTDNAPDFTEPLY
jgi:hypothetical protein